MLFPRVPREILKFLGRDVIHGSRSWCSSWYSIQRRRGERNARSERGPQTPRARTLCTPLLRISVLQFFSSFFPSGQVLIRWLAWSTMYKIAQKSLYLLARGAAAVLDDDG